MFSTQHPMNSYPSTHFVFVDAALDAPQHLVEGLLPKGHVTFLTPDRDGVEQIAEVLDQAERVEAVHIFSHGAPGRLFLGTSVLSLENEAFWGDRLRRSFERATASAVLVLYGCNVAATALGSAFVQELRSRLGVQVFASTSPTGSAARGGNWDLEDRLSGAIAPQILRPEAMASYPGLMAVLTVTSTADSGPGSLRDTLAIAQSGDTIQFAPALANQTITLTSGQLTINKTLTLDGAGAPGLTISGNNASRVFQITGGTTATLRNLIVANGRVSGADEATGAGGGIWTGENAVLTLENTQVNNSSAGFGGGVYISFRTQATIINSQFTGNDGSLANLERGGGAIATDSQCILTVQGSTFTRNRGINGGAINSVSSQLLIEGSTFLANDTTPGAAGAATSGYGGAVFTDGANVAAPVGSIGRTITIRTSRFEDNIGAGQGGGLFLYAYLPDRITVEDSVIVGNTVVRNASGDALGGGLRHGNSELILRNTVFSQNLALQQGGGLWLGEASPVTISGSTFSENRADDSAGGGLGGGIFVATSTYPVNISDTDVIYNQAGAYGGGFAAGSQAITLAGSVVAYNTANNPYNVQQQTTRQLLEGGGNIQFPGPLTNDPNDVARITASAEIRDPGLLPYQDLGSLPGPSPLPTPLPTPGATPLVSGFFNYVQHTQFFNLGGANVNFEQSFFQTQYLGVTQTTETTAPVSFRDLVLFGTNFGAPQVTQTTTTTTTTTVLPNPATPLPLLKLFDETFYLSGNPDVAAAVGAGTFRSGYEHFVLFGQREGRDPSVLYDEDYYLSQNPDIAAGVASGAIESGFQHYLYFGQTEGRDPSAVFDEQTYLAANPDVADAVTGGVFVSGFQHYLQFGQAEGRGPQVMLFDEAYYLGAYRDVAVAILGGVFENALEHYVEFGQYEGRNPSAGFSEADYLQRYGDVAAAVDGGAFASGFQHYLQFGRVEGRVTIASA
ncbi:Polymorphic membrane protein Chlamydia [Geitlerinema sp. PCC 7407]|nr:Polymorphic membrane protein Chlamydia [Geitlerinema sp. PCC 7407]